jgi:hypothetical protein
MKLDRPHKKKSAGPDPQTSRIMQILGIKRPSESDLNPTQLKAFHNALTKKLTFPFDVTGIEDSGCFAWEEPYSWGEGDQARYQHERKTKPSYQDTYSLQALFPDPKLPAGILGQALRHSDKKSFVLPLVDLECVDPKDPNSKALDDYASWFANEGALE